MNNLHNSPLSNDISSPLNQTFDELSLLTHDYILKLITSANSRYLYW